MSSKVHIFWEGHKILQNLHRRFDHYYIGQIYGGDLEKFVAFSEYMNFNFFLIAKGHFLLMKTMTDYHHKMQLI